MVKVGDIMKDSNDLGIASRNADDQPELQPSGQAKLLQEGQRVNFVGYRSEKQNSNPSVFVQKFASLGTGSETINWACVSNAVLSTVHACCCDKPCHLSPFEGPGQTVCKAYCSLLAEPAGVSVSVCAVLRRAAVPSPPVTPGLAPPSRQYPFQSTVGRICGCASARWLRRARTRLRSGGCRWGICWTLLYPALAASVWFACIKTGSPQSDFGDKAVWLFLVNPITAAYLSFLTLQLFFTALSKVRALVQC